MPLSLFIVLFKSQKPDGVSISRSQKIGHSLIWENIQMVFISSPATRTMQHSNYILRTRGLNVTCEH